MDIDEFQKIWLNAFRNKGHTPVIAWGSVDMFVTAQGIHNGPGCSKCGWTTCWHCNPDVADIPKCAEKGELP